MPARRPYLGPIVPDDPLGEPIGPSGITMAWGKLNNSMLEGLIPHSGRRVLWNGGEQNDYLALHNGSGSVYDDPNHGGTRINEPMWKPMIGAMSPEQRMNAGYATPDEMAAQRGRVDEARRVGEAKQVDAIRKEQAALSALPPNLRRVYSQLTPTEKADLMGDSPDRRYERLSSHPLLRPQADYLAQYQQGAPSIPMQMPTLPSYTGQAKPRTSLRSSPGQPYPTY